LSTYVDLREIANNNQSNWIDINSAKFVAILEQFKGIITGNYLIEYPAPDQTGFGNRTVLVSVNAPGCVVDKASGSYNRPGSATTYDDSDLAALCWNNKGITFYNLGKYDEAIKAHDEAIRLDPKDADAWYSKGNALGQQGKYDDAVKAYDKAIEINPKNSWAWYRKGKALNAIGRTNESNAAFAKAKELGGHK
jgi:tetratricopeptide (TPR) repeat protein